MNHPPPPTPQICRDDLDAHSERVAELRDMVAQIATDVGCDAADLLRGEVDALGRRLESVRETITTLADIADEQAANELECERNIEQAKTYLNSMQAVSARICRYFLGVFVCAENQYICAENWVRNIRK